jgi:hypothetical protein
MLALALAALKTMEKDAGCAGFPAEIKVSDR